jgi:F0F1-type ATP synthase membrane subunit b/b'
MEKLGISLGQLLSQICNFSPIVVIAGILAWKPMIRYLEKRRNKIVKTHEDAAAAAEDRARAKEETTEMTKQAKRAAQEYADNQRRQTSTQAEKTLNATIEEADAIREGARNEAQEMRARAVSEADEIIVALAMQAAIQILGDDATLSENARQFAKLLAVPQAAVGIGDEIIVTSAVELPDEQKLEIQTKIGAKHVTWRIDPKLIGGLVFQSGSTQVDASVLARVGQLQKKAQERLLS